MRKFVSVCLILSMSLLVCSWSKFSNAPNSVVIKVVNADIAPTVKSEIVDGVQGDSIKLFKSIIKDKTSVIPYIKLGNKIQINFKKYKLNHAELRDYVLGADGNLKYKMPAKIIKISIKKGIGTFILDENMATNLSSFSEDYEPGKTIRGFSFICKINELYHEFAFVIKTDAMKNKD